MDFSIKKGNFVIGNGDIPQDMAYCETILNIITSMKKYTHAWLAMMAMKRLDQATIPEVEDGQEVARYARTLVRWFKNYRDFVVQGAWYPDEVFCDQRYSHGLKHTVFLAGEKPKYVTLPETMEVRKLMMAESPLYKNKTPYSINNSSNLDDRCEAMAHTIVDNFKIQYREEKGNPISPSSTHMALRFFIMSHYIADGHMPLHCDARSLGEIHTAIEEKWEDWVKKSYSIDKSNDRFYYDPDGFPLQTDKMAPLIQTVEEKIISRPFVYSWGVKNSKTGDYIRAIAQYSFLLAQEMVPTTVGNVSWEKYKQTEPFKRFEEYSAALLADAVDSIARAWLHVWIRYREWGPDKPKKGATDSYSK